MSVYVDNYQGRLGRMNMCHMIADTEDELHRMADAIGMNRSWFQPKSFPHYDVCRSKREKAVKLGAIELTCRELVVRVRELREAQE